MTTGRINQVTIVCRGWPTGPCGPEEISHRKRREADARALGAGPLAPSHHSTFPLYISQSAVRSAFRHCLHAPRGDLSNRQGPKLSRIPSGRFLPILCRLLAPANNPQSPARPPERAKHARRLYRVLDQRPEAPPGGSTSAMNPPLPSRSFKAVQRTTRRSSF
jgi:hypothetical protein